MLVDDFVFLDGFTFRGFVVYCTVAVDPLFVSEEEKLIGEVFGPVVRCQTTSIG